MSAETAMPYPGIRQVHGLVVEVDRSNRMVRTAS